MAADLALAAPVLVERSPGTLIARHTIRRSFRSAILWGYVFGVVVASSAYSFTRIYRTPAERERLATTFGANHAAAALFGPAPQLQTVAGFTVFKSSMSLMIIGAVWGLLTSTRLLRGEEDSGRWQLLVSGQTTARRGTAQVLAGLGVITGLLWVITALVIAATGRSSSVDISAAASLYFALALVATPITFLGVGGLTSQVASTRRQAAAYAGVVLGVSYALRMVGDATTGAHWLVWTTPLGWTEQLRPLTDPRPWALVPIAALAAATGLLAVYLAGTRDVGEGSWPDHPTRAARLGLLSGTFGLTVRLTRSSAIWWATVAGLSGLLMGIVAESAGSTIVGSVEQVFSRLGAPGSGTKAFLGIAFLIVAIIVAFQAATQVSAARAEEAEGRLEHLLTGGVSRTRWLVARIAVTTASLLMSGIAAGLFAWIGTATQRSGIDITSGVAAGINTVPPAVLLLGVGMLAFALWPRHATTVVYAILGWSALIDLAGGFFAQNHWIRDTSLFNHMAAAPAVAANWRTNGVLLGLALVAMLLANWALRQRDLQNE